MAGLLTENRYVLGGAITFVGLTGLIPSFRQTDERLRREWASTAGPGWWLGWLISKAPGPVARVLVTLSVAAFPHAWTVSAPEAPSVSSDFARALREFCEEIVATTAARSGTKS